ncbi:MAG TPA: uroporphyrinogen-III synthase [Microvirga sp.]|jgi:uroporphyrinogen-III synthase|nr:uroporphyrinogen-III synthase [Microvirga sp.]
MRVLVTRPEADGRRTAARLAARGHEAVLAPVTRIVATGNPPPAGPWDALLLTSANAAPALAALSPLRQPVFAVGARTAAAAREAGAPFVQAAEGDALALAALVKATLPPGARLLHAAAEDRKDEPERSLKAAGFHVIVWEAYRAEAVEEVPAALLAALGARRIDAALHFSRRSAGLLVAFVKGAGLLEPFRRVPHLCLSADVAAALADLGAAVVAPAPREDALLDTLERLAGSPPPSA